MNMRAYVLKKYGGPEAMELRELPRPEPGSGQIRVKVMAAGLNPVDYKTRQGLTRVLFSYPLPMAAGNELSGVVESLGVGVTRFSVGDRVYARVDKHSMGAFAEYACVPETVAARMPMSLDWNAAASVPLAGLTALQGLRDELKVTPGQRIFIPGGAGGVGTYALQLARFFGAEVATTASPRGEALVRKLGAQVVVDYTRERFEDRLRDYDGVFDLVGGDTLARAFSVVRRGGKVVSVAGMPEPETARRDLDGSARLVALFWAISLGLRLRARKHGVGYRYLFMHPSGPDLELLARLIDEKKLEAIVDRVFPFAEIGDAYAYLETGRAKGKVVVRIAD
jgi:NADPH:quinone reductase-like Zn-dependent oxidoreductase